jgi:hypothetical protein
MCTKSTGFMNRTVITGIGMLSHQYIQKTHFTFTTVFSEMIIQGLLWVRTNSSVLWMREINTLRNNASIINM